MVRLLLGLTTFGTHVVNGFFTDYENTEERPIISWIKSLDRKSLSDLQSESRNFAEENLSWSHSVDALESIILS